MKRKEERKKNSFRFRKEKGRKKSNGYGFLPIEN